MTAFFKSLHGRNWLGADINGVQGKDNDDQFFLPVPRYICRCTSTKKELNDGGRTS